MSIYRDIEVANSPKSSKSCIKWFWYFKVVEESTKSEKHYMFIDFSQTYLLFMWSNFWWLNLSDFEFVPHWSLVQVILCSVWDVDRIELDRIGQRAGLDNTSCCLVFGMIRTGQDCTGEVALKNVVWWIYIGSFICEQSF